MDKKKLIFLFSFYLFIPLLSILASEKNKSLLFKKLGPDDVFNYQSKNSTNPNHYARNRIEYAIKNPVAIRQELIKINFDPFRPSPFENTKEYLIPTTLTLNLFNQNLNSKLKKIYSRGAKDYSWVGEIQGDRGNLVVLTIQNENIAGQIDYNGKSYLVKPLGEGIHTLYEFNDQYGASKHLEIMKRLPLPPNYQASGSTGEVKNPSTSSDSNSNTIDLMVAYTDDASAASANIVAEIQNDVTYANQVLANSCINFRYQLVDSFAVTYDETGISETDLSRLADPSDTSLAANSNLNTVTTRRDDNTIEADLVQIWVEQSDVCGLAYAPPTPATMSSSIGFSLKLRSCSATTFSHELGHNLGLAHDRYVSALGLETVGPYGSGYGQVDTAHGITTIMSYTYKCSDAGVSCSRIPYFSNPRISYNGVQLGVANFVDASRKINETWAVASDYRTSVNTGYVPDLTGCQENNNKEDSLSPCFIATATYGSPLHPHVQSLRNFKNQFISPFPLGKKFIRWYYKNSPYYANLIENNSFLKFISRIVLAPILFAVSYPFIFFIFIVLLTIIFFLFIIYSLQKFKRSILFSLLLFSGLSLSPPLYGQISSPSLDVTEVGKNPSISSWKTPGTQASIQFSSEEKKFLVNGHEMLSREGNRLNISLSGKYQALGFEALATPSSSYKINEKLYQAESSYNEKYSYYFVSGSWMIFPFISIGALYSVDELKSANGLIATDHFGAGTNLFLGNIVFLGAKVSQKSLKKANHQELQWSEQHLGIGLTHNISGTILRAEISYFRSPEVIAKATSPQGSSFHRQSSAITINGEILIPIHIFNADSIILAFSKSSETEKDIGGPLSRKSGPLELTALLNFQGKKFTLGGTYHKDELTYGSYNKEESSSLTVKGSLHF